MSVIIPAILEQTKEGFANKLSLIAHIPGVERVQVDFGDGVFIPAKLLPASEMDVLNPAIYWEAHLMVQAPEDFLDYQICGFKTLIIHYEAFKNSDAVKAALDKIKNLGLKAGLAINPSTPVSVTQEFNGLADMFLIMSVVPGKQGQSFIESTSDRISELRKLMPNAIIEVDGGINIGSIKKVSGADLIVAGSAIIGQGNPAENFEKLKQTIS